MSEKKIHTAISKANIFNPIHLYFVLQERWKCSQDDNCIWYISALFVYIEGPTGVAVFNIFNLSSYFLFKMFHYI